MLKKIASFFVTVATGKEPINNAELYETLQKWHDNHLADAPKEAELDILLELAYKAIDSLKTPGKLLTISKIVNDLQRFSSKTTMKDSK